MTPLSVERMSDRSFRSMVLAMQLEDIFFSHLEKRVNKFGIRPGSVVVDYACGPGRYTVFYSRLAGPMGKVYAVDIHPLALEYINRRKEQFGLDNVEPVLAHGYASGLPDHFADLVTAIDVFFGIRDRQAFLGELRRILKPDGVLILDDGHQPRAATKDQLAAAGGWILVEETKDHLKCKPA